METIEEIEKAFREARIAGGQLLEAGKISWDDYAFVMLGFETELKNMGEYL